MPRETMSPRERWEAVLQRRKPDRLPMDYWATPEATARLVRHLGCENIEAALARLHVDTPLTVGPRYVGPPPAPGEDIYGCHAKDSYVAPHTQTVFVQEVCPGRGNLDYETYLVRMSRLKWARALLPEHFPAEQNPEAYAYIRKTAAKVGVRVYGDK